MKMTMNWGRRTLSLRSNRQNSWRDLRSIAGEHRDQLLPSPFGAGVGLRANPGSTGGHLGLQGDDHRQPEASGVLDGAAHLLDVAPGVQRVLGVEPVLADLEADQVSVRGLRGL